MASTEIRIRPVIPADRIWVQVLMVEQWGAEIVVVHGDIYSPADLPGFIADVNGKRVGLATYVIDFESCEIVSINSLLEGRGVGTQLIAAVRSKAREMGCQRLWLVTTNDNLSALAFYQKRGFRLAGLRPGAVDESRKIKPEIPLTGEGGIPIHDEIELEIHL